MATPRWRLILNGKSAGDDALRQAVAVMRARGVALSVRVTWEHGDSERYVAEAIADGVDTIVAAGGDGTLSEVASTLAHRDASADERPRGAPDGRQPMMRSSAWPEGSIRTIGREELQKKLEAGLPLQGAFAADAR